MGLKREHKGIVDGKESEHELKIFNLRGETAEIVNKYTSRIKELESEVERLKVLNDIQVSTG